MTEGEWHRVTVISCNGFALWYVNGKYRQHLNLGYKLLPETTTKE